MIEKVKHALQSILDRFESGDIPEAIAYSTFPIPDIPAAKWSLLNRTLMFIAGIRDARGFRQWQQVGRHVKKGSKAFTILAPRFAKKETENGEDETRVLAGFLAVSVFRVEDTEGDPLSYEEMRLPPLPLIEVAQSWGISVEAIPGNYRYFGYFSPGQNQISLATKEETVFFHELAHAAHEKILGHLRPGQDWKQEIVAELAAAALCRIVGKTSSHLGNNYQYIARYAEQAKLTAVQGCLKVMKDVESVLTLILKTEAPDPRESIEEVNDAEKRNEEMVTSTWNSENPL